MEKNRKKTLISTALFIALILALAWYVRANWDDMKVLLTLSAGDLWLLLGLGLLGCLMNGLYHRVMLSPFGLTLSLTDWMGVMSVSNAMAYVLPLRADMLFTGAYYKRVKKLAYTKSLSMAAGNIVFGLAFSLLQILASLLCIGFFKGQWSWLLWLLLAAGCVAMGAFLAFSLTMEKKGHVPKNAMLADVMRGFNALLQNRRLLTGLLLCLVGSNLVRLFIYMVCFRSIGLPVALYEALFYSSVSWLAGIVAIVPGNIGIKEAVLGAASLLLGAVFDHGVAVSLLERVITMIDYFALALIFAWPVYRNFSRGEGSLTHNEG